MRESTRKTEYIRKGSSVQAHSENEYTHENDKSENNSDWVKEIKKKTELFSSRLSGSMLYVHYIYVIIFFEFIITLYFFLIIYM